MTIERHVEGIFATKRGPGILVKGKNNADAEDIFDALSRELHEFYNRQGKVMPTKSFERKLEVHRCPVYFDEAPNIKYRYFSMDPPREFGFDLELEEIAELENQGYEVQREEAASEKPRKYGNVNIIMMSPESRDQYEKEWDFPHAAFEIRKEKFLVYFKVYSENGKQASLWDRKEFLEEIARMNPSLKVSFP